MRLLSQIVAVTVMNIRNLPQRAAASIVAIVGVAAVVVVFTAVLSMAAGFERTMLAAGSDKNAVILRSGSTAELNSGFGIDQVRIVANAPGIMRSGDTPMVSAELYVVVDLEKKATGTEANVPFRGVQPLAFEVRQNVSLADGRMFEPGKNEIIVGRAAQQEFSGLDVDSVIQFGKSEWRVVGVFEAGGGVAESELWTDVRVLQNAYRRGNSFQSIRVRLEDGGGLSALETALAADPRIEADITTERQYYANQSRALSTFIRAVGYPLTILMSIGAIFGALNTMYSSVSVRGKEIATLRALGFGPLPVIVSTIVESTMLALLGGIIGGLLAWLVFNGMQVSTLNFANFSQVVFNFAVTPELIRQGLVAALVIGLVGGLFPALRAARMPVAQALREL